jgi:Na+/H+ antiporter NhaB
MLRCFLINGVITSPVSISQFATISSLLCGAIIIPLSFPKVILLLSPSLLLSYYPSLLFFSHFVSSQTVAALSLTPGINFYALLHIAANKTLPESSESTTRTEKLKQIQELAEKKLQEIPAARLSSSMGDDEIVVREVLRKAISRRSSN